MQSSANVGRFRAAVPSASQFLLSMYTLERDEQKLRLRHLASNGPLAKVNTIPCPPPPFGFSRKWQPGRVNSLAPGTPIRAWKRNPSSQRTKLQPRHPKLWLLLQIPRYFFRLTSFHGRKDFLCMGRRQPEWEHIQGISFIVCFTVQLYIQGISFIVCFTVLFYGPKKKDGRVHSDSCLWKVCKPAQRLPLATSGLASLGCNGLPRVPKTSMEGPQPQLMLRALLFSLP